MELSVLAIAIGSFLIGIAVGAAYTIYQYKRNPRFHYINAEAEIRAVALHNQLKKIRENE